MSLPFEGSSFISRFIHLVSTHAFFYQASLEAFKSRMKLSRSRLNFWCDKLRGDLMSRLWLPEPLGGKSGRFFEGRILADGFSIFHSGYPSGFLCIRMLPWRFQSSNVLSDSSS
jgi:hypothetical protein